MYFIGYDIGSSSIKAALVNAETSAPIAVLNEPGEEMGMITLKNDWAEQDPVNWWNHVCKATKRLLQENSVKAEQVKGIGISYQMHGLVIVDKEGQSLRNSIIWCDGRAVEIGNRAFNELGETKCTERLLNSPANFTASKLRWVKENEAEIYEQVYKFMLPGDYIAYRLSGQISTTVSGLSEGIFWDFQARGIANWLMDYYDLDKDMVPDIVPTLSQQSAVDEKGAKESGLRKGTPILYRAGDQPNNALSLNVFYPGEVAATGGTSGVFYAVTDSLSVKESARVNNFAHVNYSAENPRIGKLLCINSAGILYRWLLNNLQVASYDEMNALAQGVKVGSAGLCLLPFGNGPERMLGNKNPGARIIGLDLNRHSKAELCRAALEGIAFSFVYGMDILKSDGIEPRVIRAGNDNLFRSSIFSQTITELIDQEIEIYNTTGAVGAARACLLTLEGEEKFGHNLRTEDYQMSYTPKGDKVKYTDAYKRWHKELESTLKNN